MAKKAIRTVTAKKKILLNHLAEILYDFLPLSSKAKNTVTFRTIFAESSIEKYLDKHCNKLQALEKALVKVYRYHARLPQSIIRRVVPAAIGYRLYRRRPLTQREIDDLSNTLFELDIDMRKELADITIDERLPRIQVPPKQLEEHLREHDLNPHISSEPLQLFSDGHFNESVRKAAERFEDYVQEISKLNSSGRNLMADTFKDGLFINTSKIQPENQQGFVEGYKFLAMGAMSSIRNIFSHGNEKGRTPEECYEMLLFINWLFRCLDFSDH